MIALGWTLLLSSPGCVRPFVMTQRDYDFYNAVSTDYSQGSYDAMLGRFQAALPRTVNDPDRVDHWSLTLAEAKRIAIENNKQILVLATQPGQAGAIVDLQLSQFDAFWSAGGAWGRENQPLASNVAAAGTGQNAVTIDSFGNSGSQFFTSDVGGLGVNATTGGATQAQNQSIPGQNVFEILKRNATGGTTNVNYSLGYRNQDPIGGFTTVNPAWSSSVEANFTQPLLQGAGVEFNRAPILIARANFEQTVKNFDLGVQTLLRDVESLYWQLGYTYYDLYSREVGMQQALATWQKIKNEYNVGRASTEDVAQAREQFETFRAERIRAMQRVIDAERQLRFAMGMQSEDARRIIPADSPTQAQYEPDWSTAVLEAVSLRPDVVAQTYAVRAAELELFRQQNGLQPDLTVNGSWSLTGLDNQFDQSIERLTDGDFEGWTLGGRYRRQIGERSANAQTREAQLALSRERDRLKDIQHKALHELTETYRNLSVNYQLLGAQKDRREAAAARLKAQVELYRQGRTTIDELLRAQSSFADSLRDEGLSIAQYNQSLIQWEFSRGTILSNDNVYLAESASMRVNQNQLEERRRMWEAGLPVPLWPGRLVHGDFFPCPDSDKPFYPALAHEEATTSVDATTPEAAAGSPELPGATTDAPAPLP